MPGERENREVHEVLDLALSIGDVLLSSGASAADVELTMVAVTRACGLLGVAADVTFTKLTLQHQRTVSDPPTIAARRVSRRRVDYEELIMTDQLIQKVVERSVSHRKAMMELAHIVSSRRQRPWWVVTLAWGVMGAAVTLTLGGGRVVTLLALVSACGIHLLGRAMRDRVPPFYVQVAGGLLATLTAVVAAALGLQADPSRVVTAGIIMLLAGVGLLGAMEDALTGYPLTAAARLLEAIVATTGVIAGVGAGLQIAEALGTELGDVTREASGIVEGTVMVGGAALAAAAFAYASYSPWRAASAAAVVAALGQLVFLATHGLKVGETWQSAAAAVTIGAVSHVVAGLVRVPPLVLVVPAIVPLLPGLAIYRGLALLADGQNGVLPLAAAGATAIALAAGVVLGQLLAQPIRRNGRRLEQRLAVPRLAGVRRNEGRRT